MFVHDFVVVQRPFTLLLATLPALLESELAALVKGVWPTGPSDDDRAPTVVIGSARDRVDAVVYPIAWSDARTATELGVEADLELSPIDEHSCDLHLAGRCLTADTTLAPDQLRQSRREVVFGMRSLLNTMKQRLEEPPVLRLPALRC